MLTTFLQGAVCNIDSKWFKWVPQSKCRRLERVVSPAPSSSGLRLPDSRTVRWFIHILIWLVVELSQWMLRLFRLGKIWNLWPSSLMDWMAAIRWKPGVLKYYWVNLQWRSHTDQKQASYSRINVCNIVFWRNTFVILACFKYLQTYDGLFML